jgi:hypothetical protein
MQKRKRLTRRSSMVRSVVAGLGSLLTVSTPHASHLNLPPNAQSALRGDMMRIGVDMTVAIDRVKRREEAAG